MASTAAEEDDPQQSSAALCISLNLFGKAFDPEFTHQCFPGEVIPGYRPKNLATNNTHSSHAHHEGATKELQIDVQLSPSCRKCIVNVQVDEVQPSSSPQEENETTRVAKRPRLEGATDKLNTAAATDNKARQTEPVKTETKRVMFQEPEESIKAEISPMSVDEIRERLRKALPTIAAADTEATDDDYLTSPIGTVVKELDRNEMDIVMTLANGPEAAEYHNHVQKLAIWFIETADSVDLSSSEGGGYWNVLYLFRKHDASKYSLVGYMTVFHFHSPFKKPKSGTVARVCQVLILPPYQRMGLGKALLKQVYDMALSAGNDIVEINVEDPAPGCTLLRNRLDYELLKESFSSDFPSWLDSSYYATTDVSNSDFFKPLSDADAIPAGAVACITPRQVQIAYELYKLSLIPETDCPEDVLKKYRLLVKKRLVRVHREELGGCDSKEEKQALLAKIFDETLEQYNTVLKRSK